MSKTNIKKLLWLDDIRNPFENNWLVFSPIEQPFEVSWVKSYKDFVHWIQLMGLPDGICFDHDLGYELPNDKIKSGNFIDTPIGRMDANAIINKTGMDCAKWLVEYCLDNNLPIPPYNIQSANPAGKANIDGLLKSFNENK